MRTLAAAVLLLLCSCSYYKELRFSTFERAKQLGAKQSDPPVFHVAAMPDSLPDFVTFAVIMGDFDGASEERQAVRLKRQAAERGFAPDFLLFEPRGSNYAGSVSTYVGFGITTSSPIMRPQGLAYCCRLSPSSLGIGWDQNMMVVSLTDEARACGIQEGDTVISALGVAVKANGSQPPPISSAILAASPGDKAKVVWIRPGTGRMEGTVTLAAPRPWPSDVASFVRGIEASDRQYDAVNRDNAWRGGGP